MGLPSTAGGSPAFLSIPAKENLTGIDRIFCFLFFQSKIRNLKFKISVAVHGSGFQVLENPVSTFISKTRLPMRILIVERPKKTLQH
ncbi:MAG: hypothetical protein HZA01_10045 [Nitrospinae bacterium]|nr:hypothetical protein [Nitrospinota bacterium]